MRRRLSALRSFTLVELLVVMGIIAILAAITLGVSGYAQRRAGASRAQSEIAAISAALDKYKMDNGVYPATAAIPTANNGYDPTISPYAYTNNATVLYTNLAGRAHYTNAPSGPVYMEFTVSQLTTNAGAADYVTDPFGYPYGYVADDPTVPTAYVVYNKGFFDLWSTRGQSGTTAASQNADQWISNWKDY